jgi:hypothetical protein
MKKIVVAIILLSSFLSREIKAQGFDKQSFRQGENLAAFFYYRCPAFTKAKVKLKTGEELVSPVNFNLLLCQLQFINPQGDTLDIATPDEIDSVQLCSGTFFYDKGYYEIFAATASVRLAVLRKITFQPVKIGAMGMRNQNGVGVQSYTTLTAQGVERQLTINEDIDIYKETTYFLIDHSGEKIKASKAAFMKLFPGKADAITQYLKENKVSFTKESDLKKLFDFCVVQ